MSTVYNDPIMLDSTGQDIVTKLDSIVSLMGDGVIDDTSTTATDKTWSASKENTVVNGLQDNIIANTKLIKDTVGWSGKNKLPKTSIVNNTHGVTFVVNKDGSVTANGTSDNTDNALSNAYFTSPVDCQLIVNGCNSGNPNIHIYVFCDNDNTRPYTDSTKTTRQTNNVYNGNDVSFFAEAGKTYRATCRIIKNTSVNNVTFYPMFRDANILDPTYEPYFGSTAFPRSEQAVLGAKNLLPNNGVNTTHREVSFTVADDKNVIANGTNDGTGNSSISINSGRLLKAGKYILSGGINADKYILLYKSVSPYTTIANTDSAGTVEFTLDNDETVAVSCVVASGKTANNDVFKPMLRLASDPDDTYVPYVMTNMELMDAKLGVVKDLSSSNDLDSITDLGFYTLTSSPTHAPEGASYCSMMVIPFSTLASNGRMQIIFKEERMYHRKLSGSPLTWSSWSKFTGTTI